MSLSPLIRVYKNRTSYGLGIDGFYDSFVLRLRDRLTLHCGDWCYIDYGFAVVTPPDCKWLFDLNPLLSSIARVDIDLAATDFSTTVRSISSCGLFLGRGDVIGRLRLKVFFIFFHPTHLNFFP